MEIYKDIPGFEGKYQASDLGNIKSLNHNNTGKEKNMVLYLNKRGYGEITLSKNGKSKTYKTHRLVLSAFKGPSDLTVNHINAIRHDNRLENLEYCTLDENLGLIGQHFYIEPDIAYEFINKVGDREKAIKIIELYMKNYK